MKNRNLFANLRAWLDDLPIRDPVDRRMAVLLQFILLGFIGIILLALVLNPILGSDLSPQDLRTTMLANSIGVVIFALPFVLLRRGYFRASVLIVIAMLFVFSTLSVMLTRSLQETGGTLFPLTLTLILAGLLVGNRTLLFAFVLCVAVLIFGISLEQNTHSQVEPGSVAIAINFILFNGLMC